MGHCANANVLDDEKRQQQKDVSLYDDFVELRKNLSEFLNALISN